MKRPSLRWLMLIPTLITIIAGFAAFAVYIDGVEQANRLADIDAELVRAAQTDTGRPGPPADQPPERAPETAPAPTTPAPGELDEGVEPPVQLIVNAEGQILAAAERDNPFPTTVLSALAMEDGISTVNDPKYRVRVITADDGAVSITALPLAQLDAAARQFRRTLLGGGLLILLAEGLVVWFLTKILVRPVTEMAATATRIANGELDTKITPPGGGSETATLAADLDRMLNRLRDTITDSELAAAEATEARDAMQRFLADASHELRTPLTALKGYSDLYAGHMLDEPGALDRAMGRIGNESDRLARMVNDMLQLARQEQPSLDHSTVDVRHIAEAVVDDLRAANPDSRIELRIDNATNAVITANPGQIHQALLNLGSNACTYTNPDTVVSLEIDSTDTDLVLRIVDHGPGINPTETDKIFLPFYRPDDSRSRHGQGGAGLGLALVRQIADHHDGQISVAATPGGGATFTLTLPR